MRTQYSDYHYCYAIGDLLYFIGPHCIVVRAMRPSHACMRDTYSDYVSLGLIVPLSLQVRCTAPRVYRLTCIAMLFDRNRLLRAAHDSFVFLRLESVTRLGFAAEFDFVPHLEHTINIPSVLLNLELNGR